tara:strand:- start:2367 stop:3143 length:777 start_codon:yes stop_codon:yes gene_type:complete
MGVVKRFRIKSFKEQNSIVKLEKISMVYNKRVILNDISLAINRHEVLGLLGPNGVGKSTIFQIINGLQDPTYGKVIINDTDCTNLPVYERATKFKLSMCPQYGGFFYELSVLENLQTVAEIHIQEKKDRQRKIDKIIAQFSLDSILNIKAKYISGGERRKLVIGMALVNDPNILLLDEPMAALDILSIQMIQEIIINLQSMEKITIVVCDHNAKSLLSCVDRAVVLSNGKIIVSGTPNEIIEDKNAKNAYFGDDFKIN